MPGLVEEIIQQKLAISGSRRRRPKLVKPPRMAEPRALEAELSRLLGNVIAITSNAIRRNIVSRLPEIVREQDLQNSLTERQDQTVTQKVVTLFLATRGQLIGEVTEAEVLRQLGTTSVELENFNNTQMQRIWTAVLGAPLFQAEPFLEEELARFVRTNIRLIRGVQEEFLADAETTVLRGLRRGLRHEVIAQQLLGRVTDPEGFRSRFRKAQTRAKLIARDQINKLNGRLTELRQVNAGIESYVWRTSLDERVRPSHRALEGTKFRWDQPPAVGHPGEPIQCRCFAEPVFQT